ncbi:sigma-70 family RNA polymerase sigma factor [Nannocystis sp.]|uniref:RNA polymerase sigma factor n=1 Tax=Nannocystis sp. TaxID=1962667 RepID=UPI0025D14418|nr:sigma-70 family RNA polymerase sigma factor [Nannocystis sp.]MBK7829754.1 sigma-70 family RNA polymerase sigma factor [Nannocystis sp.]
MSVTPAAPHPTDEALFQRWVAADAAAGQELFKRHFDPLLHFFRRQLGDDVQDLVQQTFLGCIEARARYTTIANFRAFLFAIARNQLYKHIRRRSGQPAHVIGVSSIVALLPSPSRLISEGEDTAALVHALTRLPLEQQLALYFYYVVDMTAPQTGAALGGLSVPAVRSRLRRGLEALRKLVGSALGQPAAALTHTYATLDQWEANLPRLAPGEAEPDSDELRFPVESE